MSTKTTKKSGTEVNSSLSPFFTRENYIIIGIGLIFIALGYILLIGGGSEDPKIFNDSLFNTQRMVVAPVILVIGYVLEVFAIFYKKKQN